MLPILSRWAHVLSFIILIGGTIFIRFVLMPTAKEILDDETHKKLREAIVKRWRKLVHACIGLLIISGIYNMTLTFPNHSGDSTYHMLFGIKFLLAFVAFFFAIKLTSSKESGIKMRNNGKVWLLVLLSMTVGIVLISGVLKNLPLV